MDKAKKKRIILSAVAAFLALTVLLLCYALYREYEYEKALYESSDSARMLELASLGLQTAKDITRAEIEKAEQQAYEAAVERVETRTERYKTELMTLVNPWNQVPEGYAAYLDTVEEGFLVDRRCAKALMNMLYDCRAAGNLALICSAYRTEEYQQELFDNKIMRLLGEGVAYDQAPIVAARSVAVPGTSEHQLGLAVDIIDELYVNLDYWQQFTSVQQWLMANCTDYGFILRYPNDKSDITGIIYEPWHYRYVGISTAKAVAESGLTFEEYLETLKTS